MPGGAKRNSNRTRPKAPSCSTLMQFRIFAAPEGVRHLAKLILGGDRTPVPSARYAERYLIPNFSLLSAGQGQFDPKRCEYGCK